MIRGFGAWLMNWKPIHLCWLFRRLGLPVPPLFIGNGVYEVETVGVANVRATKATLKGETAQSTLGSRRGFDYGLTTGYGTTVLVDASATEVPVGLFKKGITGLTASTEYHFRARLEVGEGGYYGEDMTFTTKKSLNPNAAMLVAARRRRG